MERKLIELRREFEKGEQELARLEQRRQDVCSTMLRISGAIQVLEELTGREPQEKSATALCA
ncbi:MAG TPA: hypothetical protein VML19_05650 [Verrucomicrobiae bacterium]|nr:hypothetical protein [Verrucomicrobiae bacterium]